MHPLSFAHSRVVVVTIALALLMLASAFEAARANAALNASASDAADTPESFLDVAGVRASYEADSGRLDVTFELAKPLPSPMPNNSGSSASIAVSSSPGYPGCTNTSVGDVKITYSFDSYYAEPRFWYAVSGRSAPATWAPVSLSADRREIGISIVDNAITRRDYRCLEVLSDAGPSVVSDRARDVVPAYFDGWAPSPPVLIAPESGEVFAGSTPTLNWSDTHGSDLVTLYTTDPSVGYPSPVKTFYLSSISSSDAVYERDAAAGTRRLTLVKPLPIGTYWWKVERSYGRYTKLQAASSFRVGPPKLEALNVAKKTVTHESSARPSATTLTISATPHANVNVLVRRGTDSVFDKSYEADPEDKARSFTFKGSCTKPGTYRYEVTAVDEYGATRTRKGSWDVSRKRCAKLKRREAARRRAKKAKPKSGCAPGYSPCLPRTSDLDCDEIPASKKPVRVSGADPYRLDADDDGVGCESG